MKLSQLHFKVFYFALTNITDRFCTCPFHPPAQGASLPPGWLSCLSKALPSTGQRHDQSERLGNTLGVKMQVSNNTRIKQRTLRTDPCSFAKSKQTKELSPDHRSIFLWQMPPVTAVKHKTKDTINIRRDPFLLPPYKPPPVLLFCLQV